MYALVEACRLTFGMIFFAGGIVQSDAGFAKLPSKTCQFLFMCAWHDALAELPAQRLEGKTPTVTGRKGHANKARAFPEMECLEEA